MTNTDTQLRPAIPEDAQVLSQIALQAKAYWGYDQAFMDACAEELKVTASRIQNPTFHYMVAEQAGSIAGFYCLAYEEELGCELDALFVTPEQMGKGIGKALFGHAMDTAKAQGYRHFHIHSDPYAEAFYQSQGCVTVGQIASGSIAGRNLPLMQRQLNTLA